ncbi:hypothetical protein HELRODRAFT_191122 [Helobdella robusta]|uniref:SHSP domain-containing protein n=1 Tax=Helobdella robusta TaxID=6412 RepID=T1FSM2_HELRO|nr:hypothetical protein HELRODRAFT_191122 [Helobdella robusta]ESO07286.1 hypothetical protein HELRODRAFT_191122 [Helobdella robusta]
MADQQMQQRSSSELLTSEKEQLEREQSKQQINEEQFNRKEQQITQQLITTQQQHEQKLIEQQQQLTQQQQRQEQKQVSTTTSSTMSPSGAKTVKTSKKTVTSKKTTSKTTKSTKSSTSSSSSSSMTSATPERHQEPISTITSTSSSSSSQSATSRQVVIHSSGETYSQHRAHYSRTGEISQQVKSDLDPSQQIFQILLPTTPENAAATVIHLRPENLTSAGNDGGKEQTAILNFNMSEFESQSIDVRTDGNKVEVHATKKHVNPDGEERKEEFSRIYELPTGDDLDPATLQTSLYQDGVLTIELPIRVDITGPNGNVTGDGSGLSGGSLTITEVK